MAVNPVDPPVPAPSRAGPPVAPRSWEPPAPGLGTAVADAVDAAAALLAVAVAIGRYAAERRAQSRRPVVPFLPSLRRALQGPAGWVLAHPASAAVRAVSVVADQVVPEVARAVLARLDVPALVREYVDLDRLAALLDVDAVVARVDLDAVLDRVDLDAIAARLDLDTLIEKVDVTRVIDRVDLDAVVARVDLDAAVARVDLDAAVDRVDVDRVISHTDVAGLARYVVEEIDLPGLMRAASGSVSTEMVRSVRDQGVDADRAVERIVDRLLHRQGRRTAIAPGEDPGEPADDHR